MGGGTGRLYDSLVLRVGGEAGGSVLLGSLGLRFLPKAMVNSSSLRSSNLDSLCVSSSTVALNTFTVCLSSLFSARSLIF